MIQELCKPEIQKFIEDHLNDDPAALMLKASRFPYWPFKAVVEQIQSRKKAKGKLPSWFETKGLIYPPLLSMEQCSSEQTALYKAGLVGEGRSMVDLTGGFGVDFSFLAKRFEKASYVERNQELTNLAGHNFPLLKLNHGEVYHGEANDFLKSEAHKHYDLIYLDPARRGESDEKVIRLEDYSPNVIELLPSLLENADMIMLKTSPMLDVKRAISQLKNVDSVHIVALNNEVKELTFLIKPNARKNPEINCVNLTRNGDKNFSFNFSSEESTEVTFGEVNKYLYEPNAAILKGGAFKSIADQFEVIKIHPNSHLYTSDKLVDNFPGRSFEVVDQISLNKKSLKKYLLEMKANIKVRNFPMSVAQIRKKTGLKEGGDNYVFATTDINGKKALLTTKVEG